MVNYTAIRAELDAGHPITGAYDADSQAAANEINFLNIVRIRERMAGAEIRTISSEYKIKTPAEKDQWLALCSIESVDPNDSHLPLGVIEDIFGDPSDTHTAFIADRNETVGQSTVTELGKVRAADIEIARAL